MFGGSWGSTLGLTYAQTHPDRVSELVLRGIFLLRRSEIDWYYNGGAAHLFPDLWEDYLAPVPESERDGDLVAAYARLLASDDADTRVSAATAWTNWEQSTSHLLPRPDGGEVDVRFDLAFARIENHYFTHGGFLDDGQLLREVPRIAGIPGVIYGAGPRTVPESNAKKADERLALDDLKKATKVVALTLLDFLAR